jgi:hypothetical protein
MKRLLIAVVASAALAIPAAAVADSCANVSRAPADCNSPASCGGPLVQGNWLWLPSVGVPFPAWGFLSPGGEDSVDLDAAGAQGNYTNGQTSSLLGVSALCDGNGNASDVRQGNHGIQSGCE